MANTFLTPDIIAKEALMVLRSNCVAASLVYRDHSAEFTGTKAGDTVTIRKPANFEAKEFTGTVEVQDANENGVSLTLEKHFDVSVALSSKDMTLELQDFSAQIVAPAVAAIAEKVDAYVLAQYVHVPSFVGTVGHAPSSLSALASVDRVLNERRVPVAGRCAVVSPVQKEGMFNIPEVARADARGDEGTALREASMGRIMGIDWYLDQNGQRHASGSAGAITVDGAASAGATGIGLTLSGGATLKRGDIITIAGVNNPENGESVTFTVDRDLEASGSVNICPALPAKVSSGAAVTLALEGAYTNGLAFVKNAFALAVAPLELPAGAANAAAVNFEGLAMRVVYDYDINTKTDTISFDLLCGAKCIDPRLAVRIIS